MSKFKPVTVQQNSSTVVILAGVELTPAEGPIVDEIF